jgi:hypothetical protein
MYIFPLQDDFSKQNKDIEWQKIAPKSRTSGHPSPEARHIKRSIFKMK